PVDPLPCAAGGDIDLRSVISRDKRPGFAQKLAIEFFNGQLRGEYGTGTNVAGIGAGHVRKHSNLDDTIRDGVLPEYGTCDHARCKHESSAERPYFLHCRLLTRSLS